MFRRSCNCSSSSTLPNGSSPVARLRAAAPGAPSTNLGRFLQCFVLNNSPHSRWGRGIRCTSLSSREPGKIFLRVEVVSPQVFSSHFVQSCKFLNRNSNRSKNQPEFFWNNYPLVILVSTMQSTGQGKSLQVLVASRLGQASPPC